MGKPPPVRVVQLGMRLLLALLLVTVVLSGAEPPAILAEAVERWEKERHQWSFTQHVREWDGDRLVTERVERYDPTRGTSRRWQLLEVDGRAATAAERRKLENRKNRPPRHSPKPIASHVDLARSRLVSEDATHVSYEIPLKSRNDWIVPTGQIELVVTLNKESRSLERARAGIDSPFKVALGLARVMELELDLAIPPEDANGDIVEPEGTAQAVVNRFGRRIEYTWSDFSRGGSDAAQP